MDLINYRIVDKVVQMYEEKGFSKEQTREIRRGIEDNIDISQYDDINISADKMFNIRWKLVHQKVRGVKIYDFK